MFSRKISSPGARARDSTSNFLLYSLTHSFFVNEVVFSRFFSDKAKLFQDVTVTSNVKGRFYDEHQQEWSRSCGLRHQDVIGESQGWEKMLTFEEGRPNCGLEKLVHSYIEDFDSGVTPRMIGQGALV